MAYIGNTATTQAFTPAVDYFNGDGSTVAFTLSKPVASVAQVQAVIENVPQNPGSAYTVSGNTITFTSAPPSGTANIYVYYTSPITQVIAPSQGTVGSSQLQSDLDLTGSLTVDGTTLVVDDTNNRVGIGTSSPAYKLTLSGTGTQTISLNSTDTGTGAMGLIQLSDDLSFYRGSEGGSGISRSILLNAAATNGTVKFNTAGSERMRITSAGEVLINETTPILDTTGSLVIQKSTGPSINLFRNDTSIVSSNGLGTVGFYGNDTTSNTPTQLAYIQAVATGTHSAGDNPTDLVFGITPDGTSTVTEVARFTEQKYFRMASGTGGIQFGGDTAAANALDDYEEGTWTPVFISASGSFSSITYQNRTGTYVKIGSVVYVTCNFYTSAISVGTASGAVRISGLPFTASSTEFGIALKGDIRTFAGEEPIAAQVDAGSTYIGLYYRSSVTGDGAESQVSDLGTGAGSNIIGVTGFYFV